MRIRIIHSDVYTGVLKIDIRKKKLQTILFDSRTSVIKKESYSKSRKDLKRLLQLKKVKMD